MIRHSTFLLFLLAVSIFWIQGHSFREAKERELLKEIEELTMDLDMSSQEKQAAQDQYREQLVEIVETVYSRDVRSTGGYVTDAGADAEMLYSVIMTGQLDYRELLGVMGNYFEAREEYLKNIPSIWPVTYSPDIYITSGFGFRYNPFSGRIEYHPALDIAGPIMTPVVASASGYVDTHYPPPSNYYEGHSLFGGYVVIDHGNGYTTEYAHMRRTLVHEGDYVERGQVIGYMGSTGESTGPHLHYEVKFNGEWQNPLTLLQF